MTRYFIAFGTASVGNFGSATEACLWAAENIFGDWEWRVM